jgi:MFS family permease
MRATFVHATLAGSAGFAVLGLFAAVAPAFLGAGLGVTSRAAIGLVVFGVFAASTAGQAVLGLMPEAVAMPVGCLALIAGMGSLVLGLAFSALPLLVLGGLVAGFGQGLSFRAGLTAVNASAPAEARSEVASSFFVVMYAAISLPVIGEGVLADATGLRVAGITFAAAVAALAAAVLVLLRRKSTPDLPVRVPARSPAHATVEEIHRSEARAAQRLTTAEGRVRSLACRPPLRPRA